MSVLFDLLNKGKSPIQVVEYAKAYLEKQGFPDLKAPARQKASPPWQLFIKQVLRNKNYGSCHARVADKKGMYFDVHTLFSFVGAL